MIERKSITNHITEALKRGRIVSLLGPRQCGKTTLARRFAKPGSFLYFDLEDPVDSAKMTHPKNAIEDLKGIVVIDESVGRTACRFDDVQTVVFRLRGLSNARAFDLLPGRLCVWAFF